MSDKRCPAKNDRGIQCGLPRNHNGNHWNQTALYSWSGEKPVAFGIESHDPFALATIRAWIVVAHAHKVSIEKILKAEAHFKKVQEYQAIHGTKLPG